MSTLTPSIGPGGLLLRPTDAFDVVAERPLIRLPVLVHLAGSMALVAATTVRSHDSLTRALSDLGVGNVAAASWAVSVLLVLLALTTAVVTLLAGGLLTHVLARAAGGRAGLAQGVSTYLVAMAVLAVRNVLLAAAMLSPWQLDPARLGAISFGDPFLVFGGFLLFTGLRRVYGLSTGRAALVAGITTASGAVLTLLTAVGS